MPKVKEIELNGKKRKLVTFSKAPKKRFDHIEDIEVPDRDEIINSTPSFGNSTSDNLCGYMEL